jgi:hypothetical protein
LRIVGALLLLALCLPATGQAAARFAWSREAIWAPWAPAAVVAENDAERFGAALRSWGTSPRIG